MSGFGPRFLLLHGNYPGEGVWSHANSYAQLVAQVREAYGENYNPIFKYKLPANPKALSPPNGTCYIIIDDEDDFNIWLYGCTPVPHHRDRTDDIHHLPTPLTDKLYLYRMLPPVVSWLRSPPPSLLLSAPNRESRTSLCQTTSSVHTGPSHSPPVLHADDDVVKTPLYPLLPPLLLIKLGVRVVVRHSDAPEAILLSSRTVSGEGEGHWGLLLRKVQRAWGVQRPCLRYLDLNMGVTAINIFNVRDYMCWSTGVGRERNELIALEHLYRDEHPTDHQARMQMLVEESNMARESIESRIEDSFSERMCTAPARPYTATTRATVRGVACKLFGPSFTTDGNILPVCDKESYAEECSLQHHRQLVAKLRKSGLF
uniref:Uncharacterized protein TCIL3000_11_13820 n=1 Tax=Trypanosoma congolense (strain IL3000) TaxID=1068625 RepID=G0V2K4_TRYCI|nr:unnamed protein product [Trypanosoma congolense IL3000]